MDKQRCQSCGMPLGEGFYGTDAQGQPVQDYCTFCYQNGAYTRPDMTMEEMIKMSIDNMTQELKMPQDKAEALAYEFIPKLNRWKK